jgi:hypothetical protein
VTAGEVAAVVTAVVGLLALLGAWAQSRRSRLRDAEARIDDLEADYNDLWLWARALAAVRPKPCPEHLKGENAMTDSTPGPDHAATDPKGDANQRALRTLATGAIVTGLGAVAATAATIFATWTGDEIVTGVAWSAVGVAAGTAGLQAVASYVARFIAPPK